MNYLDRSVSKWTQQFKKPIPKREYQLFAVASLYIAIKIHGETDCLEGPRRKLKIDAFYELSRKQFDVQLIEETERQILEAINWNVNPPTTLKFIATFLFLCPKWQAVGHQATNTHASVLGGIYDVARYLTELSVCQSYFSFSCKNSVVAYSAILVAIESLSRTLPLPFNARDLFIGNIWRTTGLRPNDPDVLMACDMLKRLCPNICNAADIPDELIADKRDDISIDGKTSPICVVDTLEADVRRRKRSRSTASTSTDGSWRPIQNQK